ncbi:transposase [Sinomonas flava]|uniref:transposase n=1 Tax=Sinomonas flava TaxID=496857 RepID=UPI003CD0A5CD
MQAAWEAKQQRRTLLASGSLHEASDSLSILEGLVDAAPTPETKRLLRTVKRWWTETKVPITTGATTAKVEANNTAIKIIKRPDAASATQTTTRRVSRPGAPLKQ